MKKTFKISIVDYKVSNLKSVSNALNFLEINNEITSNPKKILASDAAILPGVGSFSQGMKNLKDLSLIDPIKEFINYVNSSSVIWQIPETDYWKNCLNNLVDQHFKETQSQIAKTILENFNNEVQNFKQVCPKEMLDKLTNPLLLKTKVSKAV